MSFLEGVFTPRTRRYLYQVAIAVMALLGALGIIQKELYAPILGLVTAILGFTLAQANTPSAADEQVDAPYAPKHADTEDPVG